MSKNNPFLGYMNCLFATHITQKWVVFTHSSLQYTTTTHDHVTNYCHNIILPKIYPIFPVVWRARSFI